MKRKALWICNFLCSLVLLAGCSAPPVPPVQENANEEEALTKQLLSNEATSNYYRTILPYKTSPT
ncbi:MAG: CamS family sex pheromone protein, partial [Turicibacter sp.]|nr:CamS family sex pheromone protein [Turicibacter sp.]